MRRLKRNLNGASASLNAISLISEVYHMKQAWRVAVASTDGKIINEHFGRAGEFYILDIQTDGTYAFVGKRPVDPICVGNEHTDDAMAARIGALLDCRAVLVARIGPTAKRALEINKIAVFEEPDVIHDAVTKLGAYFIRTNF